MKFTKPGLFIITAFLLAILASCGLVKNEDHENSPAPSLKTGTVTFYPVLEENGDLDCTASGISYFEVTLKSEGEESALKGPFSCEEKVITLTDLTPGYRDITLEGKNIDGITLYTETIVNYHVSPKISDAGKVTLNAIDRQAPSVVSVLPVAGTTVQAENPLRIGVEFNEPIDGGTLTVATFTLSDGVNLISGAVTYNMGTAKFMPSLLLNKGITYVATVTTGVKDLAGNPLEKNYSWSFSTATGYIDRLPPEVVSTNPTDGATDVPVNTTITATFNEQMNPATIDTTSFLVSDGAVNIEGAVTYDQNTKTATFSPATPLDTDKSYTVTVTESAKDSAGNSLTAFPWAFRTTVDQVPVVTVCFIPGSTIECDSPSIQGGINLAGPGTTIRVAGGTYNENLTLKSGTTLEGGWSGSFSVRDTSLYESIIDGSGTGGYLLKASSISDVTVDGFTIQNGSNFGIWIENGSKVVISNNNIDNNKGGIFFKAGSEILISKNQITKNVRTNGDGGGINLYTVTSTRIENNTVAFNSVWRFSWPANGGGIHADGVVTISKNIIHGNDARGSGGGVYTNGSSTILENSIFNNSATGGGGGINSYGTVNVSKNFIYGNTAPSGGGISFSAPTSNSTTLSNNIISNNASTRGGGIQIDTRAWAVLAINNTITENSAESGGSGINITSGSVAIKNTILWGNTGEDFAFTEGATIGITYSNICNTDGVTPYTGAYNKCEDPLFIDPSQNNFHLQQTSPMIDMATPSRAPDHDIDGDTRPQGPGISIDIGADEVIP